MSDVTDPSTEFITRQRSSFSFQHRAFRALWYMVWLVLASWTPPPFHAWRRLILRIFGAKIGEGARIYGSSKIWYPPNLEMGKFSILAWRVNCYNQGKISIGDYAVVSQYSHLVAGTHDIDSNDFALVTHPIVIESWAWIASDAFVGPGVTVGEGAVLGGRGVTFKDLEPWTVYVGNPCQVVRKRRKPQQGGV